MGLLMSCFVARLIALLCFIGGFFFASEIQSQVKLPTYSGCTIDTTKIIHYYADVSLLHTCSDPWMFATFFRVSTILVGCVVFELKRGVKSNLISLHSKHMLFANHC